MSNKKKRQHYVPQFYLKNFTNNNNSFSIFNISKSQIINNVPYNKQCYEDYYYGKDENWELKLSKLESTCSVIINKLIYFDYYPNHDEITLLKEFIIYQRMRTKSTSIRITTQVIESNSEIFKMKLAKDKIFLSEKEINSVEDFLFNEKIKSMPENCLELAKDLTKYIADLKLSIVTYDTKNKLVSSDNPVIYYNNFHEMGVGLSIVGLIIFLPISPNKLIVLYDKKSYINLKDKLKIKNENEVNMLNNFQYIVADQILFFNNIQNINDFIKYKGKREMYKKMQHVQTLGVPTNKIISHKTPNIPIKHEFYFARLHPKLKRASYFKLNEKDMFPREYEKGYEQKMNMRVFIFDKKQNNLNLDNINVDLKNIKKFNNIIKDYWNNNL